MSNRSLYPSQNYGSSRVYAEFQFTAPGAGTSVAVSSITGADIVASIAHTAGTNVLTVTLKDTFNKVIAHAVDLRDDTPNGAYATLGTFTNEGSASLPTFNINTWNAAGTALNNPAAVIVVTLALRNGNWGVK